MLWEKRNPKKPNERGYLYIRETIYVRDKRSHKRKPKKLGDGKATKERGKYSKKKDIYCGRIIEKEIKQLISFEDFMKDKVEDFLEYKLNSRFHEIVEDFKNYLITIYEIDREEFESRPKKAYEVGNGFLSEQTLDYIEKFTVRKGTNNKKEIERFAFRCEDAGIFDPDIIHLLFTKIAPEEPSEEIKEELENLKSTKLKTKQFKDFRGFMKEEHERN